MSRRADLTGSLAFSDFFAFFLHFCERKKQQQGRQAPHCVPFDRYASTAPQALRTCGVVESQDICNQFFGVVERDFARWTSSSSWFDSCATSAKEFESYSAVNVLVDGVGAEQLIVVTSRARLRNADSRYLWTACSSTMKPLKARLAGAYFY